MTEPTPPTPGTAPAPPDPPVPPARPSPRFAAFLYWLRDARDLLRHEPTHEAERRTQVPGRRSFDRRPRRASVMAAMVSGAITISVLTIRVGYRIIDRQFSGYDQQVTAIVADLRGQIANEQLERRHEHEENLAHVDKQTKAIEEQTKALQALAQAQVEVAATLRTMAVLDRVRPTPRPPRSHNESQH